MKDTTSCPEKRCATDFLAVTFTNIDGFSQFFVHNFARECQSHRRKNLSPHIYYVATIPSESLRHNFEPLTFCCVLFVSSILVALNVIDINMCKVLILV